MARVEDAIIKNLGIFVAFARNRLGDHHLAEDVVQDSLIKALAADRHPETEEETTTWFYRILRRSIIDVYRKQGARSRALERFEKQLPETPDEKDERELCKCFRRLLPLVPEQYRELLEEVDLKGQEPEVAAAKLGVTKTISPCAFIGPGNIFEKLFPRIVARAVLTDALIAPAKIQAKKRTVIENSYRKKILPCFR